MFAHDDVPGVRAALARVPAASAPGARARGTRVATTPHAASATESEITARTARITAAPDCRRGCPTRRAATYGWFTQRDQVVPTSGQLRACRGEKCSAMRGGSAEVTRQVDPHG